MLDSVLPNVCEFWNPVEESQLTLRILVASLTEVCRDVIRILEDLGLLLRGEIIWQKSRGSSGSCAWARSEALRTLPCEIRRTYHCGKQRPV